MSTRSTISVKIPTEMIGKVYENIHGHQVYLGGEYLYIFESGKWYVYNGYNCNGPLEDYLSPEISSKDDMISLPKNFCYYLHGYLSGLSSTQREDKGLDSIIKTLEGYLDV